MGKQAFGIVACTLLLASSGRAAGGRIVGVVTSVERHSPPTLQVSVETKEYRPELRADGRASSVEMRKTEVIQTRELHTDEDTAYVKWITHRPWQEDARLDPDTIVAGQCIDAELRSDGNIADVVHVNTDTAGSASDPCKSIRRSVQTASVKPAR
jgi:hypothetical protein